ncbi:helix-turn-helix transcriptional regulator [Streptomyces sp. CC208A]|uniref:helix-turn-helix domain-containing protein n=1 Tax=Streptomyces sp. CC208A TaxID=3044573 RepID=UPI0024A83E56|nr:helix-turn-helix transcriptional regulator [Streptomyces sp. CC208A]
MANVKELDPSASPQAAYGALLRRVRMERGFSQDEMGERMGYSSTHISSVETGRKMPTLPFSRKADAALETGEKFQNEWRKLRFGILLEGFSEYADHESRAVEIRLYEIGIIPGLVQTPEYARCLADSAVRRGSITPEQADDRVAVLEGRQQALVRPRPPAMLVVMDESCIRREVGGPEIMGAQLDRLLEFADQPHTVLQIAPFSIGERRALSLPVYLLTLPDVSVMAYAESQIRGHLERETASVFDLLKDYHQLQAEALPHAASVALIREARKAYP